MGGELQQPRRDELFAGEILDSVLKARLLNDEWREIYITTALKFPWATSHQLNSRDVVGPSFRANP